MINMRTNQSKVFIVGLAACFFYLLPAWGHVEVQKKLSTSFQQNPPISMRTGEMGRPFNFSGDSSSLPPSPYNPKILSYQFPEPERLPPVPSLPICLK